MLVLEYFHWSMLLRCWVLANHMLGYLGKGKRWLLQKWAFQLGDTPTEKKQADLLSSCNLIPILLRSIHLGFGSILSKIDF